MSVTKIVLDRQAKAKAFTFGDTSASGAAAVVVEKGTGATSATVFTVKATAQVDGDLVLGGNLVITGSINEQTVTNLNVTDKTITLNKGGAAASGGGSGFTVEENSVNVAGLLYDSALTSKFKIGATGSEAEVVTVSGAQTLTNKTIAGSQISGNISGNAANVTGTVGIGSGGTGQTSQNAALNALLPAQGSANGKVLQSNGTDASWVTPSTGKEFKRLTVTGTQDGSNKTFTISSAPTAGTDMLVLNGQVLKNGASDDYTLSGTTVTFNAGFTAPEAADVIQAYGSI